MASHPIYELGKVRERLDVIEETPDAQEAMGLAFEIPGSLEDRIRWLALRVRELDLEAENYATEAKRLKDRQGTVEGRAAWYRVVIGLLLERAGQKRVDGIVSARRQKAPASVAVSQRLEQAILAHEDLRTLIPAEFVRVIPERTEVDKKAVLEAHRRGDPIPAHTGIEDTKESVILW
jgi:hypothetical protein